MEQLSLYLPARSVDHFMPTVLWNSKGSTHHREINPAGQAIHRHKGHLLAPNMEETSSTGEYWFRQSTLSSFMCSGSLGWTGDLSKVCCCFASEYLDRVSGLWD